MVLNSPSSSCLYCSVTLLWFQVLLASSFTTGLRLLAQPQSPAAAREGALRGWRGENDTASPLQLPSGHSSCTPLWLGGGAFLLPGPPLRGPSVYVSSRQRNKKKKQILVEVCLMERLVFSFPPTPFLFPHSGGTNDFILFNSPTSIPFHLDLRVGQKPWSWIPLHLQPLLFRVVLAGGDLHQNLWTTWRTVTQKQFFTDPLPFTTSQTPFWHFEDILKWDFNCFPSIHYQCSAAFPGVLLNLCGSTHRAQLGSQTKDRSWQSQRGGS